MPKLTRRSFTKTVAAAGAAMAASSLNVLGANEKIRLGFIGLGNRGDQVLDAFLAQPDAQVVAVCDLHQPYLDFAAAKAGGNPRQFKDYRKLLEIKELDAVVISTPDHWHALQTIHACEAGKDVYVEKPLSLCVAEGRRMVEAVRKHNRVCQVGIHRRSVPFCREAAELIRSGVLGKIMACRAFHIQNEWPQGIDHPPDTTPPPGFDWEAWLGPAPYKPYNKNRTFYRFRWFFDYSGGQLTNFGVHYMDFFHMALGVDAPLAVAAMGGKYALADNREIPDTLEVMWEYPGGILITFTQINANAAPASLRPNAELEIRGTKGTFYLYSRGYEIVPDLITPNPFPARTPLTRTEDAGWRKGEKPMIEPVNVKAQVNSADTTFHARNFLDCVKNRQRPTCDIETGHRSTSATQIGNIAWKTRALLEWDAQLERFPRHAEANRYLDYPYRPRAT
ncbi:Gfo/Idh/MocA family oxidoreductase [Fontisphaera persica]|uniref:Gfo/Idh/MocA family protein n=1 Tax=Fontisphaera persica TaxID=2974023 RepID=UPI0024C06B7F|nr:Gfo/Idh/MocA family oxidoreductase [Fontisphaera persica]WCJ60654.1 Gfo/Idh/MocA family oxidoreductase [Fontisphaera persica]